MKSTVLFSSSLLLSSLSTVNGECDACTFWDGFDPPNCKVYGQMHDGGLIAWNRASEKCLDYYNIHADTVNAEDVAKVFPNPDGTDGNLELFIDLLREDSDATSGAIFDLKRFEMSKFFKESNQENTPVVFQDRIQLGLSAYDCTANQGNDCWTALRVYFAQPGRGSTEMRLHGSFLWNNIQKDRESEQQSVRMAICNDRTPSESICGNLVTQIYQIWRGAQWKDCSDYGLGPEGVTGGLAADCSLDAGGGQYIPNAKGTSGAGRRLVGNSVRMLVLGVSAMMALVML